MFNPSLKNNNNNKSKILIILKKKTTTKSYTEQVTSPILARGHFLGPWYVVISYLQISILQSKGLIKNGLIRSGVFPSTPKCPQKDTHYSFIPLLFIRWGASQILFYFGQWAIWLAHHWKNETMEAPQNRGFYFEV
jgi:hypothetical protein